MVVIDITGKRKRNTDPLGPRVSELRRPNPNTGPHFTLLVSERQRRREDNDQENEAIEVDESESESDRDDEIR